MKNRFAKITLALALLATLTLTSFASAAPAKKPATVKPPLQEYHWGDGGYFRH